MPKVSNTTVGVMYPRPRPTIAHSPRFLFSVPPPCASGFVFVAMGTPRGTAHGSDFGSSDAEQQYGPEGIICATANSVRNALLTIGPTAGFEDPSRGHHPSA